MEYLWQFGKLHGFHLNGLVSKVGYMDVYMGVEPVKGGGLPARTERVRSGGKTSATDIMKG